MKGVLPAAGLGTRLLPATKAQPKEMLPIVDRPAIQYVVEEAAEAGLRELIIITAPGKGSMVDHFSMDPVLLERFEASGKLEALRPLLDLLRKIPIRFVTQKEPRGLGDAILQARHAVGNEPFTVLLGDDILVDGPNPTSQLLAAHAASRPNLIGVQEVPMSEVSKYGIIDVGTDRSRAPALSGIVEKPKREDAPSNLAAVGRYLFSPRIFDEIRAVKPDAKGEIQLTDAIRGLMRTESVHAVPITAHRLDVGGKLEWLVANIEMGLRDPTLGPALRTYLDSRNARPAAPPAGVRKKK